MGRRSKAALAHAAKLKKAREIREGKFQVVACQAPASTAAITSTAPTTTVAGPKGNHFSLLFLHKC